jgi:hypothetical protein
MYCETRLPTFWEEKSKEYGVTFVGQANNLYKYISVK